MRRGIHISIALVAVLTLFRPLDCFAGAFTPKAADCCAKGKCSPTTNSDECCKTNVPGGILLSAPKTPDHPTPAFDVQIAVVPNLTSWQPTLDGFTDVVQHPPPLDRTSANLPLLI